MAKTQTYSDELLTFSVVKYAEEFKGKIILTRLVKWAGANVPGLEGVKAYHYTKQVIETDPETGKKTEKTKHCMEKIQEINSSRSVSAAIKTNVLLKSANIEEFLGLPHDMQRQQIMATRCAVDDVLTLNQRLTRENAALKKENEQLLKKTSELDDKLHEVQMKHSEVEKMISRAVNAIDLSNRKAILGEIGVQDGGYDLNQYMESIRNSIDKAFSINAAINEHESMISDEDIMEGIDF